jgi:hypothetical protein
VAMQCMREATSLPSCFEIAGSSLVPVSQLSSLVTFVCQPLHFLKHSLHDHVFQTRHEQSVRVSASVSALILCFLIFFLCSSSIISPTRTTQAELEQDGHIFTLHTVFGIFFQLPDVNTKAEALSIKTKDQGRYTAPMDWQQRSSGHLAPHLPTRWHILGHRIHWPLYLPRHGSCSTARLLSCSG